MYREVVCGFVFDLFPMTCRHKLVRRVSFSERFANAEIDTLVSFSESTVHAEVDMVDGEDQVTDTDTATRQQWTDVRILRRSRHGHAPKPVPLVRSNERTGKPVKWNFLSGMDPGTTVSARRDSGGDG